RQADPGRHRSGALPRHPGRADAGGEGRRVLDGGLRHLRLRLRVGVGCRGAAGGVRPRRLPLTQVPRPEPRSSAWRTGAPSFPPVPSAPDPFDRARTIGRWLGTYGRVAGVRRGQGGAMPTSTSCPPGPGTTATTGTSTTRTASAPGRLPYGALVTMMAMSFLLVSAEFLPNGVLTEMAVGLRVTPGQAGQTVTVTA